MSERVVTVSRMPDIADGKCELVLDVDAETAWEIFPVRVVFPSSVKQVRVKGKDGDIVFASDEVEHDPMLLVFCHNDGQITIKSDGAFKSTRARLIDVESGLEVDGGVMEHGEGYVTAFSKPLEIQMPPGRLMLDVTVVKASQLSLDLYDGDAEHAGSGVTIAFDQGWANVYRDVFNEGIYSPEKREKSGYFNYTKNESIVLLLQRDDRTLRVNVSTGGVVVSMKDMELPSAFDRIKIRESASACGGQGVYEVKVL